MVQLRDAVATRQMIGMVTGLLAGQTRCTPERAWQLLVNVSQTTNVKVRVVAKVLLDVYCGQTTPEQQELAFVLTSRLPDGVSWSSVEGALADRGGSRPDPRVT